MFRVASRDPRAVERVGESPPGGDDARVLGADQLEVLDEAHTERFAVVTEHRRDEVEETSEGVLDVPATDVEVGDGELGRDVRRAGTGRRADLVRGLSGEPVEQRHLGQTGHGHLVVRVLQDRGAVLADRGGVVPGLDRVVRGLVVRRQGLRFRLTLLRVVGLDGSVDLDPAGDAVLLRRLQDLLEDVADLGLGQGTDEQSERTATDDGRDGRDRLCLERLDELRVRVGVDLGQDDASRVLLGQPLEDRRQLLARTAPLSPDVHDDRTTVESWTMSWKLWSVTSITRDGTLRTPSVGAAPAAGPAVAPALPGVAGLPAGPAAPCGGRWARSTRDERSTAPRRLDGVGGTLVIAPHSLRSGPG